MEILHRYALLKSFEKKSLKVFSLKDIIKSEGRGKFADEVSFNTRPPTYENYYFHM
jgi:hypothetical protein